MLLFQDLDPSVRRTIAGLRGEHSFEFGFQESLALPGGREKLRQALEDNPPRYHPVVRTHPVNGKKCLFVNRLFTSRLVNASGETTDAEVELLRYLCDFMERPEYQCSFAWEADSVAFWDNRCTQHRPNNDYFYPTPQHRRLQRVTINGCQPR